MKKQFVILSALVLMLSFFTACDTVGSQDSDSINTCEHAWGSWIETAKATCTQAGTQVRVCGICSEEETETIAAIGHSVVIDEALLPTCEQSGLTEGKHCSVCDAVIVKQSVVPKTDHVYGSWTVLTQATQTQPGMKHKACKFCAWGVVETIPALQDTDPSALNVILYELRSDGYWVTGIVSWVDPVLTIPEKHEGKAVVGIASKKAFYKNSVIEEVVFPNSIKVLEPYMFYNCRVLKKVTLPDGIQSIPKGMFYNCQALETVNIPTSVKEIGLEAFAGCKNLNLGTITLDCSLGDYAFRDVQFDILTVKSKIVTNALENTNINKLILAEGVETIGELALMWSKIGDISFPTTLKTIENGALYGVTVEKLVFTSAVHFTYGAFNNCRMKEVVIPKGSSLERKIFMNCHDLETVYFGGTRAEWERLVFGYSGDYIGLHVICSDDA